MKTITETQAALLFDTTPCFEIDTTGSASEHPLGDLVRESGYSSLTSYLNDSRLWGKMVCEVAAPLLA